LNKNKTGMQNMNHEANNEEIKISSSTKRHLKKVCYHEVGHWLVTNFCNFFATDIEITATDNSGSYNGSSGIVKRKDLLNKDDIIQYIEDRIKILYAGILSEYLENGKVQKEKAIDFIDNVSSNYSHIHDDHNRINELFYILVNIIIPTALPDDEIQNNINAIQDRLVDETIAMLEKSAYVIIGLADRLLSELKYVNKPVILTSEALLSLEAVSDILQKMNGEAD